MRIGAEAEESPIAGRCMDCRAPVEVAGMTVDLARTLSVMLRARGESGLSSGEIVRCDPCTAAFEAKQGRALVRRQADAAEVYGKLREMLRAVEGGEMQQAEAESRVALLPASFVAEHAQTLTHWRSKLYESAQKPSAKSKGFDR